MVPNWLDRWACNVDGVVV